MKKREKDRENTTTDYLQHYFFSLLAFQSYILHNSRLRTSVSALRPRIYVDAMRMQHKENELYKRNIPRIMKSDAFFSLSSFFSFAFFSVFARFFRKCRLPNKFFSVYIYVITEMSRNTYILLR